MLVSTLGTAFALDLYDYHDVPLHQLLRPRVHQEDERCQAKDAIEGHQQQHDRQWPS